MSNSLDRICTVDISLASPISNDANFDNILILGPAPANPTGDVPAIGVYNSLEELTALDIAATGERADPVGVAARVAFSQSPRPHEVYVAFMGDIVDKESEDPALQTVSAVLENALAVNGWYCICPVGLEDEQVKEIIQWTETQNKLCGYIDKDPENPIVDAGLYLRSFPFFPKETADQLENDIPAENLYGMAVAAAVKAMNYHAGQETWALMPLSTVSPSKLTSTFIKKLEAANFNYVITVASKNITQGGKTGGGEWIDVIRFRDWLQNDMQVRVVNLLIVNPKIPYTDNGIGLVENQMLASLKDGQKYGGIAPTEYDADGNAIPGYTTSVPLAADLTSTQKASRILKDCKFSARIAGAIHVVEIKGCLTYENLYGRESKCPARSRPTTRRKLSSPAVRTLSPAMQTTASSALSRTATVSPKRPAVTAKLPVRFRRITPTRSSSPCCRPATATRTSPAWSISTATPATACSRF